VSAKQIAIIKEVSANQSDKIEQGFAEQREQWILDRNITVVCDFSFTDMIDFAKGSYTATEDSFLSWCFRQYPFGALVGVLTLTFSFFDELLAEFIAKKTGTKVKPIMKVIKSILFTLNDSLLALLLF
jgi:hypothetical protein